MYCHCFCLVELVVLILCLLDDLFVMPHPKSCMTPSDYAYHCALQMSHQWTSDFDWDNSHGTVLSIIHYNLSNLSNKYSDSAQSNQINNGLLVTLSPKRYDPSHVTAHHDEEKIAKNEMPRELFLTKEQMRSAGQSCGTDLNLDFAIHDLDFAEPPLQKTLPMSCWKTLPAWVCATKPIIKMQTFTTACHWNTPHPMPCPAILYITRAIRNYQIQWSILLFYCRFPVGGNYWNSSTHSDPPDNTGWGDPLGFDPNDITVVTNNDFYNFIDDDHDHSCFFSSHNAVLPNASICKG